jgi:hypothetical protein
MDTFSLSAPRGLPYLLVEASGPATLAELCACIDFAAELAHRTHRSRALLNLLQVEIALSFTEHLQLGSHAADRLKPLERVASVVPARYRTGSSEKAAQKSGLHLRTFTALDEGVAWLTESGTGAGP